MAKMSENNGPKEDAMTTPISSLAVSPETARVIQAQMAVATGRPALLMGVIVAAVVSATVPLFILVLFFQRQIVSGLTAGAVKG